MDDNTFTNKTWSKVSGMQLADLNVMEFEFLQVLDFRLFVRKDEFEQWKVALINFRAQLENANLAEEYERQQQIIRATLRSVGVPVMDQQWTQGISQAQQHQQQQQQYNQYLNLFSKAQQPQFPLQQINGPLARVPLRIPMLPVYANPSPQHHQSASSSAVYNMSNVSEMVPSTVTNTVMPHQQQPQQPQQQSFYPINNLSNITPTQQQATVHNTQQYQMPSTAGSSYGAYNDLPRRPMSASSGNIEQYNHPPVSYVTQPQPHTHVSRPRPSRATRVHSHQYAPLRAYAIQRVASATSLSSAANSAYHLPATVAQQRHAYVPNNNAQMFTNSQADWQSNNNGTSLSTPDYSNIVMPPSSVTLSRSVTQTSSLNYEEAVVPPHGQNK